MTTSARVFTTWITSLDRVDHAVTDEECAARLAENRGVFQAVCGDSFLPGPMEGPAADPCGRCVRFLRARLELRDFQARGLRHSHRRRGWLSRLCRRKRSADADSTTVSDASASAGDHGRRQL